MRRRGLIASVLVAATILLCAAGVGAIFTASTLHVGRRLGAAPGAAVTVSISGPDGVALSAWWMRSSNSAGNCVIVLHGIADSRVGSSGFAPMFLGEGYSVLLPDSRGHGASGGQYVTYGLLERYDVIAWTRWMRKAGCAKIFGLGESLGASILIEATAIEPVFTAAVAESAYADLREIADYRIGRVAGPRLGRWIVGDGLLYAKWMDGLDLLSASPLDSMARTSTPILLIHGLADDETPPVNSERLAKANPRTQLWLVPGAGHVGAFGTAPEEFRARVLHWFESEAPSSFHPAAASPGSRP